MLMRYLSLLLCVILHGVHGANNNNNELSFREKAERYMSEYFFFKHYCFLNSSVQFYRIQVEYLLAALVYVNY